MTDIDIYIPSSEPSKWGTVPLTASSRLEQELMKTDKITLVWNSIESKGIPMGSYVTCPLNGVTYYLLEPYYPKAASVGYTYTVEFQSELMMLAKIPFLFYTEYDGKTAVECDWNFTGNGKDLKAIMETSIFKGIGVSYAIDIDSQIEASLSLSFGNVDILTALNNVCSAWNCEWYTEEQRTGVAGVKKIYIVPKVVHGAAYRLKGGDNVEMPSSDNKGEFFNRFYVFGSTRNIPQNYEGALANHAVNKRLTLDPSRYPNSYIDLPLFNEDGTVATDKDGHIVTDPSIQTARIFTKVLTFDDIYPKSNCRVKGIKKVLRYVNDADGNPVILADGKKDFYYTYYIQLEYQTASGAWSTFIINTKTYTKDNPTGSLIKGKTLSLHFNSGALEGRDFEATYYEEETQKRDDDGSLITIPANSFGIKYTQDNNIILPNTGIEPKSYSGSSAHDGDKVVVFNINMPASYYDTACMELEEKGIKQIYEETKDGNEYTVKSNPVSFMKDSPNLSLGRHITLDINGRAIDTRVTALTTSLDRVYEQTIKLSKAITKGAINTLQTIVASTEQKVVNVSVKDDTQVQITKQQLYRAQEELRAAVFDVDGDFQQSIMPTAIRTQMLSVGATSQNFQLQGIVFYPNYGIDKAVAYNKFFIDCYKAGSQSQSQAQLVHFGINMNSSEPRIWSMTGGEIVPVQGWNDASVYYLYAVCSKTGAGGTFVLSTEKRVYDIGASESSYYFLVGVLGSAFVGANGYKLRILSVTYGTSTINGRFITTGRIASVDGETYIDLDTGEIRGNFVFRSDGKDVNIQSYVNTLVTNDLSEAAEAAVTNAVGTKIDEAVSDAVANLNITVGARNYLLNTGKPTAERKICISGLTASTSNATTSAQDGVLRVTLTLDHTNSNSQSCRYYLGRNTSDTGKLTAGGDYILSGYIRTSLSSQQGYINFARWESHNGSTYTNEKQTQIATAANTDWKYFSVPIVLSESATGLSYSFIAYYHGIGDYFELRQLKLEKGSMASDWSPAPEDIDSELASTLDRAEEANALAAQAEINASAAQETADNAVISAKSANDELEKYASDKWIVPTEKSALLQQYNDIKSEYTQILSDATKYSVATAGVNAYKTAYNNVVTAMNFFTDSATWSTNIDISKGTAKTYYGYISAYYTARTAILNLITIEAYDKADKAALEAESAKASVQNFTIGGRNLIRKRSSNSYVVPSNKTYNQYDFTTTKQYVNVEKEMRIWAQYKVDNWEYDYAPFDTCILGQGDGDPWSRRFTFSKFEQIGNTRMYFGSVVVKTTDTNILNVWDTPIMKLLAVKKSNSIDIPFVAYDIKVEIGTTMTDYTPAPEDVDASIASAYDRAEQAAETANNAVKDATEALSTLDKINNDGYVSPSEKEAIASKYEDIYNEYYQIKDEASKYSVSTTDYKSAKDKALSAISKYTKRSYKSGTTIDDLYIAVETDYENIAAYYVARQNILNAITEAAKSFVATTATSAASTAVGNIKIGGRNLVTSVSSYSHYSCDNGVWKADEKYASDDLRTWNYSNSQHKLTLDAGTYMLSIYVVTPTSSKYRDCRLMNKEDKQLARINSLEIEGRQSVEFTLAERTDVGVMVKIYEGTYRIKIESGNIASDWTQAQEDIEAAIQAQAEAQTTALGNLSSTLTSKIDGVQTQVDGKIDTWFKSVAPTTSNAPASSWTTSELKKAHTDDLYYNTATGYVYRWTGSAWSRIKDTDITSAMTAASNAQASADGKVTTFTTQPVPPYSKGDMWIEGADGDIKYCITARKSGSYVASDWGKASKYTDDTAANAAQETANQAKTDAQNAQTQADKAISDAADAQATADEAKFDASSAQTTADAAKTELDKIGNDNYITSSEKCYLVELLKGVKSERDEIVANIARYKQRSGVDLSVSYPYADNGSTKGYDSRYTDVVTLVNSLVQSMETQSKPANYDRVWDEYYTARQTMWETLTDAGYAYSSSVAQQSYEDYYGRYGYLNDAIYNGASMLEGGLILANVLGVGDFDKNTTKEEFLQRVKAGLSASGTSDDSVRMWAGASSENKDSAPFRVNQGGEVTMTKANIESENADGNVRIANGQVDLIDSVTKKNLTEIVPKKIYTIDAMLASCKMDGDNGSTMSKSSSIDSSSQQFEILANVQYDGHKNSNLKTYVLSGISTSVTLFTPKGTGLVTIDASGLFSWTGVNYYSVDEKTTPTSAVGNKMEWVYNPSISLVIKQGANIIDNKGVIYDARLIIGEQYNISLSGTYNVTGGVPVTAELRVSDSRFNVILYHDLIRTGSAMDLMNVEIRGATLRLNSITYKSEYENYNNRLYADGLFMSTASDNFFGICPTAGKAGELMRFRQGNRVEKVVAGRRVVGLHGGALFAGFALYAAIRVTIVAGVIAIKYLYNPNELRINSERNSAGQYTFKHSFGLDENYIVQAIAYGTTRTCMLDHLDATEFKIIVDNSNGSHVDPTKLDILIFDCSTY